MNKYANNHINKKCNLDISIQVVNYICAWACGIVQIYVISVCCHFQVLKDFWRVKKIYCRHFTLGQIQSIIKTFLVFTYKTRPCKLIST